MRSDFEPLPDRLTSYRDDRLQLGEVVHPSGFRMRRHAHETLCIQVVLEGHFRERGHGERSAFGPGTVLVRPAGFEHENPVGGRAASLCMQVGDDALSAIWDVDPGRAGPKAFVDPMLWSISMSATRTLRDGDPLSPSLAASLAAEVIGRVLAPRRGTTPARDPRLARRAAEILRASVGVGLSVEELASRLETGRFHLARCFRSEFGVSLSGFARRLRLERAIGLIFGTREPLVSIAADCGFADQAHMSRDVRAWCELPPSRLRD
jgi:AraC family transcriptional regulator